LIPNNAKGGSLGHPRWEHRARDHVSRSDVPNMVFSSVYPSVARQPLARNNESQARADERADHEFPGRTTDEIPSMRR